MRPGERGFVTLAALLDVLIITLIGAILMTSLFGEIQGEFGYNQAVSATSTAEAGLHWAGSKLTGPAAALSVYAGDMNQALQAADGQQVGMFDVVVACADGSAVGTGCPGAPITRMIRATGYVPSKASVLGQRTVQAVVAQETFFEKTICAFTSVNLGQGVTVQGDVGSAGTSSPDLTLQGPSGSAARIHPAPGGVQPGSVYAVGSINCSQGCAGQVAGSIHNTQAPNSVCPNRTRVWSTYACTPGSASLSGGAATISAANNSLGIVTLGAGGTLIFRTTGPTDVLTVNVATIAAGKNTQVIIQGGGTVILNVRDYLIVGQGSYVGVDNLENLLPASHLIVRSCNTGTTAPAIWFNQSGVVSAVFIAPYSNVYMDQVQLAQGAVLANTIRFDQGTGFRFDKSAGTVGFGFTKLRSWQDVP